LLPALAFVTVSVIGHIKDVETGTSKGYAGHFVSSLVSATNPKTSINLGRREYTLLYDAHANKNKQCSSFIYIS
jgi:hypothetical protein